MKDGNLEDFKIPKEILEKTIKNKTFNELIEYYYRRISEEYDKPEDIDSKIRFLNKKERMERCNDVWIFDWYKEQKIKDIKKLNLCRDRYCSNCKKATQAIRMAKYIPFIEQVQKETKLKMYHMVFTCPNVKGEDLRNTIDKLFKAYFYLNRYLDGRKKIKDVDFTNWGYAGSIRSLEVTFTNKKDSFHPHLHVIGAFENNFLGKKSIKNAYSVDKYNRKKDRLFAEEEILIQKIWYLLMNEIEVNKKNIESVELGYSCMIDKFTNKNYVEVFKYITKTNNGKINYDNFKSLYFGLLDKRQLQSYGCFHGKIGDSDDAEKEEMIDLYESIINLLRKKEAPVESWQTLQKLLEEFDSFTIISKNNKTKLKYFQDALNQED